MKCKQGRKEEKERLKLRREFVSQLKQLNPKRNFSVKKDGNEIYVDTYDLWKLNLPDDWKVVTGIDQQEVKDWGFMSLESLKKEDVFVYIYGW